MIFIGHFFTFLAPFMVGLAVADTVGNFVNLDGIETIKAETIILSGLLAWVSYNLITTQRDRQTTTSYSQYFTRYCGQDGLITLSKSL